MPCALHCEADPDRLDRTAFRSIRPTGPSRVIPAVAASVWLVGSGRIGTAPCRASRAPNRFAARQQRQQCDWRFSWCGYPELVVSQRGIQTHTYTPRPAFGPLGPLGPLWTTLGRAGLSRHEREENEAGGTAVTALWRISPDTETGCPARCPACPGCTNPKGTQRRRAAPRRAKHSRPASLISLVSRPAGPAALPAITSRPRGPTKAAQTCKTATPLIDIFLRPFGAENEEL